MCDHKGGSEQREIIHEKINLMHLPHHRFYNGDGHEADHDQPCAVSGLESQKDAEAPRSRPIQTIGPSEYTIVAEVKRLRVIIRNIAEYNILPKRTTYFIVCIIQREKLFFVPVGVLLSISPL